jgi:hypothetical protein
MPLIAPRLILFFQLRLIFHKTGAVQASVAMKASAAVVAKK